MMMRAPTAALERTLRELMKHGEIVAGSEAERNLVGRLRARFEDLGLEVELHPVRVLCWEDEGVSLRIRGDGLELEPRAVALPYSPSGWVEGELVFAGTGVEPEEWHGVDAEDKVVLLDWATEEIDDVRDQYLEAVRRGALAVIFFDPFPGRRLRRMVITCAEDYRFGPALPLPIPVVAISREDGLRIVERLKRGARLRAELHVRTRVRHEATGYNVIARLGGSSEEAIVLAAHHDHWLTGAADDCIGVALLLELAARLPRDLKRTVIFASFTAEESGAPGFWHWYWIYGSRAYVERLRRRGELEDIVLVLNPDVVASKELIVSFLGWELQRWLRGLIEGARARLELVSPYCDALSFALEGVSTVCLHSIPHYMEYYHTDDDVPEHLDWDLVSLAYAIMQRCVLAFGRLEDPVNPGDYIAALRRELGELAARLPLEALEVSLRRRGRRARLIIRSLNARLFGVAFEGAYEDVKKPFEVVFLPQLLVRRDLSRLLEARRLLEAGQVDEAIKLIREVPPLRTIPGFERRLPALDLRPLLKRLARCGREEALALIDDAIRAYELLLESALSEVREALLEALNA